MYFRGEENQMKKILMSISAAMMLLSPFAGQASAAEPQVTWKGNEIKVNQLGVVRFVKDVKTYKRNPEGEIISVERGKAGLAYRVYSIVKKGDTTVYNIGINTQVQQTNLVKYENVPLDVRKKFYVMHTKEGEYGTINYPEFKNFPKSEIANENIQNLIVRRNVVFIGGTVSFDDKEGKIMHMSFGEEEVQGYFPASYHYSINTASGEVKYEGASGGGPWGW